MWHLYWHQDEAGNRVGPGLFPERHKEQQSPKLSYGTESDEKDKVSGREEPSSAGPKASIESQSRLKRPKKLSGARLFFNTGPIDFNPLLDLLLVPLYGLSLWFLRTPTQRMKQAAYVIHMVSDTESRLNQFSDSGACPKICLKTSRFCSLKKSVLQIFFGLFIKFRRTTRRRLSLDGLRALISEGGFPPADTSTVNFKSFCDLNGLKSIFQEIHSLESAAFQCFWASGWSHLTPPAHSIGH
jgi:hypothetical protein